MTVASAPVVTVTRSMLAATTAHIYNDANSDATQDGSETGLAGVTVNLLNGAGTAAVVESVYTPATGAVGPPGAGASADVGLVPVSAPIYPADATVLTVGVGEEYQTIAAAIAASQNGDVILVDSGTYTNDFAVVTTDITLVAVGGRVTMNATESPPNFKGIL